MVSPRAATPAGGSVVRAFTELRTLGARTVPTRAAHATIGVVNELVVVQRFVHDDALRGADALRDARAATTLRHPNLVRMRDVLERDGEVVLVSQFVEGETLAALRSAAEKSGERLPLDVELRMLVDVLAGLAALHGVRDATKSGARPLGIVHGELAPVNVVASTDGVARVIQLAGIHVVASGGAPDTLGYVAPEILLADDGVDLRADVYAAGVMLWEALSGAQLFTESSAGAIVTRHLSGRIRKATVPSDASWAEPLVDVAHRALATDPSTRHATAVDLAGEIKRIARTNLASAAKVASWVKRLGADSIARRKSELSPSGAVVARPAGPPKPASPSAASSAATRTPPPKPVAPAKPSKPTALPRPAPSIAEATTRPVPEEGFDLASDDLAEEDFEESAVKPRAEVPEPSVHDRITTPSPLVAAEAAMLAEAPIESVPIESVPIESVPIESVPIESVPVESVPIEVVATTTAVAESSEAAPAPRASEEVARAASLDPPIVAPLGAIDAAADASPKPISGGRDGGVDAPPLVGDALVPESAPFGDPSADGEPERRRKRRGVVFAIVAIAALFLLFVGVRLLRRGAAVEPPVASNPTVEPRGTTAPAVPEPAADPEPPAAPTATAADPAIAANEKAAAGPDDGANAATAAPAESAVAEPAQAAPSPPAAAPAATTKPAGNAPAKPAGPKPKPQSTYDPLGI